jgi:hypothetical protein
MSFDSSRFTFAPWKDFSGVVMPQGRVQLDSDWNEWLAELARRIRAGTLDIVGRAVYPSTTPNAFLITPTAGSISIGVGRMYVDGLLVENHGLPAPQSGGWIPPSVTPSATQPAWDRALDELVGQNPIDYLQQPYFPNASKLAPFPTGDGPYLAYLDVWQREITFLEYPDLIEKAVGVDTAGRYQTVWQVRWLDVSSVSGVTCSTKDSDIGPWETLIQPSAGRLTTGVVQSSTSGPCCLAPNTGYTGLENQLYRVEIHDGGSASSSPPASFKWSRDNGSVATGVTGISQGGTVLTVQSTGKDSILRFSPNDWVEITDDWLELNGFPGELHQVALVTDAAKTIQLSTPVSSANFPVDANNQTDPTRHTRVIRWDQSGKVYESDGKTVWTDLDATGTGQIPVPPPGTSLILENGVTVSFDLRPNTGVFKVGDYWNFAARTVDGTVENLVEAPRRGIHHHYARLAILNPPNQPSGCRVEWPPAGEGGGCDCGSCVTAAAHNNGSWTIQNAIDAVSQQGGGKVCLGPGIYNIQQTIVIDGTKEGAQNIVISGHGLPLLVPAQGFGGDSVLRIQNSIDIGLEDIAFAAGMGTPTSSGVTQAFPGIVIEQSMFVRVDRCSFGLLTDTAHLSPAIAFGMGTALDCSIRSSIFANVDIGIGLQSAEGYYLLTQIEIDDNQMSCNEAAVLLSNSWRLFVSGVRFTDNFVQSISGFVLAASGLNVTVDGNSFSITPAAPGANVPNEAAVVCDVGQVRIADNNIVGIIPSLTVTPGTGGSLSAGTYMWVVTALDGIGRETLAGGPGSAVVSAQGNATLSWNPVVNAASYNIYRSVANGTAWFLDTNVPQASGTTFLDSTSDQALQQHAAMPVLQNDGIVLGRAATEGASVMEGCQVTGNVIGGIAGTGIQVLPRTSILDSLIADNELLNLGQDGIRVTGLATALGIRENTIANVGLVAPQGAVGISVLRSPNLKLCDNRIEGVGALSPANNVTFLGLEIYSTGTAQIANNRFADIGPPTSAASSGALVAVLGLPNTGLEFVNNEIRRASVLPSNVDQPGWLALIALGRTVSVRGNLLESFGQNPQTNPVLSSVTTQASSAYVAITESCLFTDNRCFQDDISSANQKWPNVLVVELQAANQGQPIIAMGNYVHGPSGRSLQGSKFIVTPSLTLTAAQPAQNNTGPVATVLGNITSNGIEVNNAPLAAPWAPLNIQLP